MRIGLVTCKNLTEPDPDAAPLTAALTAAGHEAVWVPWDDTATSLAGFELFVMRSCWNYFENPEAFVEWTEAADAQAKLLNSPAVVRWNLHKRYLLELERGGVPVVPTQLVEKGSPISTGEIADHAEGVVIKPAIAANSDGVRKFAAREADEAAAYCTQLATNFDVIIQPFLGGYADPGERSLIWIDGEWTHAIRKHPRFAGDAERVDGGEPPTTRELDIANTAIAQVPHEIGDARVDLVQDNNGKLCVSELELMEPSLFFDYSDTALPRFVKLIERWAG